MLRIIDEKNEKTLHEKVLKMNFTINLLANCHSLRFFYKFVTIKIILTTQNYTPYVKRNLQIARN